MVIDFFENQSELKLDYFKITDPETLKEIVWKNLVIEAEVLLPPT